jgi:hypothetical protein
MQPGIHLHTLAQPLLDLPGVQMNKQFDEHL